MKSCLKSLIVAVFYIAISSNLLSQSKIPIKYFSSQSIGVSEGLDGSRIFDIVSDKDGFLWTRTSRSIQYWDGAKFNSIEVPIHDKMFIVEHPINGILAIDSNQIFHITPNSIKTEERQAETSNNNYNVDPSSIDSIRAETYTIDKQALYVTTHNETFTFSFPDGIAADYLASLCKIKSDKLVIGVNKSIFEFDLKSMKWSYEYRDLSGNMFLDNGYCGNIIIDKFGSIWVTTVSSGVVKINANSGFTYLGSDQIYQNFVKNVSVDESNNRVLVAGLKNGLILFDTLGNNRQHIELKILNEKPLNATGIYFVSSNKYIFLNQRDSNIYQLELQLNKPTVKAIGKLKRNYVYYQSHYKWDERYIYFGFDQLYKYDIHNNKFKVLSNVQNSRFTSMCRMGNQLVIGAKDKLILYDVVNDLIKEYPLLNTPYIRGIEVLKDSNLYLATDAGLLLFDIQTADIDTLYNESIIYSLSQDQKGNIWAGTGNGILMMDNNRHFTLYGAEDGIQGLEFNTNANIVAASGKIYFGGTNGVSAFYPDLILSEKIAPHLYIKKVTSNSDNIDFHKDSILTLSHDQNTITIKIGAIGSNQKYHYSYKINNEAWIDQEQNSTFNFNLTSGSYNIAFKSCIPYNATICSYSSLDLIIMGPWWKSHWVVFSLILLFIIGTLLIFKILQNRKAYQLNLKHEYETKMQKQKIDISRDLHDSIGSQLSYLNSSLDNLQDKNLNQNQELLDLKQYSNNIIQELRDMIWVLHTDKIHLADLHFKILDHIDRIRQSKIETNIEYDISTASDLEIEIDASTAGHIFKCIQEVIHNGIKHSKSQNIYLTIDQTEDQIVLSYKDEGVGFDPTLINKGNGLQNLKTRVLECKGKIDIKSGNNQGTIINLNFKIGT